MTSLIWRPIYGVRGATVAESPLGMFRTHAAGGRVTLTLNDIKIADHSFAARAKRHAERLLEAFVRRQPVPAAASPSRRKTGDSSERPDSLPLNGVAPAPPAS